MAKTPPKKLAYIYQWQRENREYLNAYRNSLQKRKRAIARAKRACIRCGVTGIKGTKYCTDCVILARREKALIYQRTTGLESHRKAAREYARRKVQER